MNKLINLITIAALQTNTDALAATWSRLRARDISGSGRVNASELLDASTIAAGNGTFWAEHTTMPGVLFLFSPSRVLAELNSKF